MSFALQRYAMPPGSRENAEAVYMARDGLTCPERRMRGTEPTYRTGTAVPMTRKRSSVAVGSTRRSFETEALERVRPICCARPTAGIALALARAPAPEATASVRPFTLRVASCV